MRPRAIADPSLVLSTLKPLVTSDPTRKCFRLIGGVLVQRTVKDVVPALETNYAGIKDVLETLVKTYKTKEEEFAAFQREHKIVVSTSTGRPQAGWCEVSWACLGSGWCEVFCFTQALVGEGDFGQLVRAGREGSIGMNRSV